MMINFKKDVDLRISMDGVIEAIIIRMGGYNLRGASKVD